MTGLFITSTGTEIGKTHFIRQLLFYDQNRQKRLTASKPVISGWPKNERDILETDTGLLLEAQQLTLTPDNIAKVSPWRFYAPLTPSMAAQQEGRNIEFNDLISYSRHLISQAVEAEQIHLMEGVGGLMAPITKKETVLDWIKALGCPCILVVGSYLGSLSHTLTAVSVLRAHHINILAVVLNKSRNSPVSLEDTLHCLGSFLSPLPIFTLGVQEPRLEPACLESVYTLHS